MARHAVSNNKVVFKTKGIKWLRGVRNSGQTANLRAGLTAGALADASRGQDRKACKSVGRERARLRKDFSARKAESHAKPFNAFVKRAELKRL